MSWILFKQAKYHIPSVRIAVQDIFESKLIKNGFSKVYFSEGEKSRDRKCCLGKVNQRGSQPECLWLLPLSVVWGPTWTHILLGPGAGLGCNLILSVTQRMQQPELHQGSAACMVHDCINTPLQKMKSSRRLLVLDIWMLNMGNNCCDFHSDI